MGDAVAQNRRHAGKAEDDFVDARRRRIAVEPGADVGVDQRAHERQRSGEFGDDLAGFGGIAVGGADAFGAERQLERDLALERGQRAVERVGDERVDFPRLGPCGPKWRG
jgi:hypothetical protein